MYHWRGIEKETGEVLSGGNIRTVHLKDKQDDKTVLRNPHKGLYHHYYDNCLGKYLCLDDEELTQVEGLNYLYVRVDWSDLEPEEGIYDWSLIDELVERFYKPYGFGLSFCIVCKETSKTQIFATPKWVENAGAKGEFVSPPNVTEWANWTPDYSDPIYLEKLEVFHMAFAKRYQDQPFTEEIIVGSVGDWGEGHAWFSGDKTQTLETLKKHIDMYVRCYPRNQLYINDDFIRFNMENTGKEMELVYYCLEQGLGIRDDSINVDGEVKNFSHTHTVRKQEYFDAIVPHYPANMELEHYQMQKNNGNWVGKNGCEIGADLLRGAIDRERPTYFSFHGYARDWYVDNKEFANEVANKCGYWYFLESVTVPLDIKVGEEAKLGFKWINKGVARAYNSFQLLIKIENDTDQYILETRNSDNQSWLAYQATNEIVSITIPNYVKSNEYMLKIKLVYADRFNNAVDIKLAFKTDILDSNGFYEIDSIIIK